MPVNSQRHNNQRITCGCSNFINPTGEAVKRSEWMLDANDEVHGSGVLLLCKMGFSVGAWRAGEYGDTADE